MYVTNITTVREHPELEEFSSSGEIGIFKPGEILQNWRNGVF